MSLGSIVTHDGRVLKLNEHANKYGRSKSHYLIRRWRHDPRYWQIFRPWNRHSFQTCASFEDAWKYAEFLEKQKLLQK